MKTKSTFYNCCFNNTVTSNQISTYRKLNLPLISSIYFIFLPLEMQKNSNRPKYTRVFYFCLKRNDPQTFRIGTWKIPFLQCICYCYELLRLMFLILCDTLNTLLFKKICRYSEIFKATYCCFIWNQYFERSSYFIRYLHNNNTMLILKFENEADYVS